MVDDLSTSSSHYPVLSSDHPVSLFSVKRYIISLNESQTIERWVVVGNERDYLVTPQYCSCRSFLKSLQNVSAEPCKHIHALLSAQETYAYNTFYLDVEEYEHIRLDFLPI